MENENNLDNVRAEYLNFLKQEISNYCNSNGSYELYWDSEDIETLKSELSTIVSNYNGDDDFLTYVEDHVISSIDTSGWFPEDSFYEQIENDIKNSDEQIRVYFEENRDNLPEDLEEAGYKGVDYNVASVLGRINLNVNVMIAPYNEQNFDMSSIITAFGSDYQIAELDLIDPDYLDNGVTYLIHQQGHTLMELYDALFGNSATNSKLVKSVASEIQNNNAESMSGLTACATINAVTYGNILKLIQSKNGYLEFPENTAMGIYNSWVGSGSTFDIELEKPFIVPVAYIRSITPDTSSDNGEYSVSDVYGGNLSNDTGITITNEAPNVVSEDLAETLKAVAAKYGNTDLEESYMITEQVNDNIDAEAIANFLAKSVQTLLNTSYTCCAYKLDDKLSLYVGWTNDPGSINETDIIHAPDSPNYIMIAGIKVSTSDYMQTDYDYLNFPYDSKTGEVFDTEYLITTDDDYDTIAKYFIEDYAELSKYELADNGEILNDQDNLEEARLGNHTFTDSDEAEYYRNKELYDYSGLARHREAMEKAKEACKAKGIDVDETRGVYESKEIKTEELDNQELTLDMSDSEIVDYIVDNFKKITGEKLDSIFTDETNALENSTIFNQPMIDKTFPKISSILNKVGITNKRLEDIMDELDNKLVSIKSGEIKTEELDSSETITTTPFNDDNIPYIEKVIRECGINNDNTVKRMAQDVAKELQNNFAEDTKSEEGIYYDVAIVEAIRNVIERITGKKPDLKIESKETKTETTERYRVFLEKVADKIAENLDINRNDIRIDGETALLFRYNGNKYFARPSSMYQVDIFDDNNNQIGWSVSTDSIKQEVFTDYSKNDNMVYDLVGGEYAGTYTYAELVKLPIYIKDNDDSAMKTARNNGGFTHRKELDDQPILNGYLGPMWDGVKDNQAHIRYETQGVYDMMAETKDIIEESSNAISREQELNQLLDLHAGTDIDKQAMYNNFNEVQMNNEFDEEVYTTWLNNMLETNFEDIFEYLLNKDDELENELEDIYAEPVEESKSIKTESQVIGVDWGYFDKFNDILKQYLSPKGQGNTYATQIVTAINNLVYHWYANGDVYDNVNSSMDGGANDLTCYANWLATYVDGASEILDKITEIKYGNGNMYELILKDLCDEYLTDEFLKIANESPLEGDIYKCSGPYEFDEYKFFIDEDGNSSYDSNNINESLDSTSNDEFQNVEKYVIYTAEEVYPVIKKDNKFLIARQNSKDFTEDWELIGILPIGASINRLIKPEEALTTITDWKFKNGNPKYTVVDKDHGTERIWGGTTYGARKGISSFAKASDHTFEMITECKETKTETVNSIDNIRPDAKKAMQKLLATIEPNAEGNEYKLQQAAMTVIDLLDKE